MDLNHFFNFENPISIFYKFYFVNIFISHFEKKYSRFVTYEWFFFPDRVLEFFIIIATKAAVIWLMTTALGGEGCFATN